MDEAKKIADDATTDLKVRYFLLPLVPLPNLATTDLLLRLWEQEVFKPSLTQV